jgi:hypothetical protein
MKMNCNLELKMTVQELVNIDKDLSSSDTWFAHLAWIFSTSPLK